jgi:hypothetical protein
MEGRLGHAFGRVRVHTDAEAARSAKAIRAHAYAFGSHIVMGAGRFQPHTPSGSRLLAHELTHVVQQTGASPALLPTAISDPGDASELEAADLAQVTSKADTVTPAARPVVQRTIGDGHDLTAPRFSHLVDLEAAYDGETIIETGASGRSVQAIQQALYDFGFSLPKSGADGTFGPETKAAVMAFQLAHPPLVQDGRVGPRHDEGARRDRWRARPASRGHLVRCVDPGLRQLGAVRVQPAYRGRPAHQDHAQVL